MADDPADNHTASVGTRRFLCVEYPARVKRVDRAIRTLGGEDNLAAVTITITQMTPLGSLF